MEMYVILHLEQVNQKIKNIAAEYWRVSKQNGKLFQKLIGKNQPSLSRI